MRDEGNAVVTITHRIDDVFRLADLVTVIKAGNRPITEPVDNISKLNLIQMAHTQIGSEPANVKLDSAIFHIPVSTPYYVGTLEGGDMKIVRISEVIQKSPANGASGAIVHGDSLTTATWTFKKGIALPPHHHPHEQITVVVEGTVELTIDGKTYTLTAGDHAVIPGDVEHAVIAVTDATVIDAFHPVREDLR